MSEIYERHTREENYAHNEDWKKPYDGSIFDMFKDGSFELIDLSNPFGRGNPLWPSNGDFHIDRVQHMPMHYRLLQTFNSFHMHNSTHADSPAHVIPESPFAREAETDLHAEETVSAAATLDNETILQNEVEGESAEQASELEDSENETVGTLDPANETPSVETATEQQTAGETGTEELAEHISSEIPETETSVEAVPEGEKETLGEEGSAAEDVTEAGITTEVEELLTEAAEPDLYEIETEKTEETEARTCRSCRETGGVA